MAVFLGHVMFRHRQARAARPDAEWAQITGGAEPLQYRARNKCAAS